MENILYEINRAYERGIQDPRFKNAISEIIENTGRETTSRSNREMEQETNSSNTNLEKKGGPSQREDR